MLIKKVFLLSFNLKKTTFESQKEINFTKESFPSLPQTGKITFESQKKINFVESFPSFPQYKKRITSGKKEGITPLPKQYNIAA